MGYNTAKVLPAIHSWIGMAGRELDQVMLDIGSKLRAARLSRNLTLRELALKVDLSPSLLSQIEKGKVNPSVVSLYSIASALAIPIDHFFPDTVMHDELATAHVQDVRTMTASELRTLRSVTEGQGDDPGFSPTYSEGGPVVRENERATIELMGGVTWSRLTSGPEASAEFLQATYDVGGSSGPKMSHHAGREFTLVLEGQLLLELAFEKYHLDPGDSIIFDSTTPHRLSNVGQVPVRLITVILKCT